MKRLLALALAPTLLFALGCDNNKDTAEPAPPPATADQMPQPDGEIVETTFVDEPAPAPATSTEVIYVEPEPAMDYTAPQPATTASPGMNMPATPAPGAGESYTVQKGDTLWSIAKTYYGDGQKWREIVAANPGLDPQKLRVGQQINLP